jgi:hypothetical protein
MATAEITMVMQKNRGKQKYRYSKRNDGLA